MSRHESVSCDSCMRANFKGKRYKCLSCYDYDLCSTCYESGVTTTRHSTDHPMQCIITRADFDVFYGGDGASTDHPQSYTCPHCAKMGFSKNTLQEHVTVQHSDCSTEIICPICASISGGDPNHVTDDFIGHMTAEHRWRDVQDEPTGALRSHRRMPNSRGRGSGGHRSRHFTPATTTSSNPSSRESMDPIAELLSHLSGVHNRVRGTPQQLRELHMQIDAERALRLPPESLTSYREHLQQRLPRGRPFDQPFESHTVRSTADNNATGKLSASVASSTTSAAVSSTSKYALANVEPVKASPGELELRDEDNADHSLFVQEFLMTTLTERLQLESTAAVDDDEISDSSSSEESPRLTTEMPVPTARPSIDEVNQQDTH